MSQRKPQRSSGATPQAVRTSPDELAERHLGLVMHIVRDFKQRLPPCGSLDDLVGAGNLGLVATRCTRGINLDAAFRRPRSRVISRW